jgi:hypothetical protein
LDAAAGSEDWDTETAPGRRPGAVSTVGLQVYRLAAASAFTTPSP